MDQFTPTPPAPPTYVTIPSPPTPQPSVSQPPVPPAPTFPQSSPASQTGSNNNNKVIIVLLAFIGLLLLAGGVAAYIFLNSPEKKLMRVFEKLKKVSSVTVGAGFPDLKNELVIDFHKDLNKLSKVQFTIDNIDKKPGNTFTGQLLANSKNAYLHMDYSHMQLLLSGLRVQMPGIEDMQTYRVILPFITGKKWVDVDLSVFNETNKPTGVTPTKTPIKPVVSAKDEKEIEALIKDSIIFHPATSEKLIDGITYDKLSIGFKKDKLLALVNKLKDLELDMKLSEINSIKKVVESVDTWNGEIVSFYLDNKEGLAYAKLALPVFPKEALKSGVEENSQENFVAQQVLSEIANQVDKLKQTNKDKLQSVLTLRFTNYDAVATFEAPTNTIKAQEIIQVAQKELLPLFGAFLMNSGSLNPSFAPTTPTTPNRLLMPTQPVMYQVPKRQIIQYK